MSLKTMPFLSVIIVTWNNENYIEQALASCIDECASNYEVIVVHNASDDRTGELIRRAIEGHENLFRVVENARNEGLGEARNIGVSNASGEYFIFLDGDDWFEPGVIGQLITKLRGQNPDVLLYDYQRAWDTGWKAGNGLRNLLYEHDASAQEKRRPILSVFCIACNKAYRKSFIERNGIRFSEGYYEDVAWTYQILLSAETIYVIPLVVLNYRQRSGSILRSTDARHLVLPDRYDYLYSFLEKNPEMLARYGAQMLKLTRAHLFARPVWPRLPSSKRRLYLKRASNVMDKWRALTGETRTDWTLAVAKTGSPILYSAGKRMATLKDRLRKKLRSQKTKLRKSLYQNILCRLPVNKKRVYIEICWGERFDGNPLSLARQLRKRGGYEIFIGVKKGVVPPDALGLTTVCIGSLHYWYVIASSYLLITDTNLGNNVYKRKNTIHLQTQHGTPLKYMGLDVRGNPLHPSDWPAFAARCRRWDYLVSSNPYSSEVWRRAFPYEYKVLEMGYPRNDIFFNATSADIARIRNAVGAPQGKKIALYAPTYKDYNRDEAFCPNLSFGDMQSALGDDYILLIRAHKFAMPAFEERISCSVIDVSDYVSSNELCLISDLLITDYSSIMFDYACLKRPIVLFQYDYEKYVSARGVYLDIRSEAPGIIANNAFELLEALGSRSFESAEAAFKLEAFNAKFCPWDDGKASERVLSAVLG